MVGHRLRISLVLLAVAVNHVTCNYLAECPALAGPGCTFAGESYADGSFIESQCLLLRCDDDQWVVTGGVDSSCGQCSVFLDPHLTTSDGFTTSLIQAACIYSLIQPGLSDTPDVSVVGHFRDDCKELGSCMGKSVFKDNSSVSVEIGKDGSDAANIFTVYVGAESFTVPDENPVRVPGTSVLAWRASNSCIRLLGSSGLSMEKCEYHQFMWSHPDNAPYYGLCGLYTGDGNVQDDLTWRDNHTSPLNDYSLSSFAFSWLTSDQVIPSCAGIQPSKKKLPSLCLQETEKRDEHRANCTAAISAVKVHETSISNKSFDIVLDACVFDLCLISQTTGEDQDKMSEWLDGPVADYTERMIYLELAAAGCMFGGQSYSEGEKREDSCDFYVCHHGQWSKLPEKKVPSCCSSDGDYYENEAEASVDCEIKVCSCGVWEDKGEMDSTCCEYDGNKYEDGETKTFDCAVQQCSNGNWSFVSDDPTCCEYGGNTYEDGETETFDCAVQRCNSGNWDSESDDPTCCEYDDRKYEDSETETFDCAVQRCSNGEWVVVSNDTDCCVRGDQTYAQGDTLAFNCAIQRCSLGAWTFDSLDPNCCREGGEEYEEGEKRTMNCKVEQCIGGRFVDTGNRDPKCCEHNGSLFPDGASRTSDCRLYVCFNGQWNDTGVTDPKCCEIGGRLFEEGTHAVVDCYIFECVNGSWNDTHTMDPNCGNPPSGEHTEHREGSSGCDETEACFGVGRGLVIQIDQQVNRP